MQRQSKSSVYHKRLSKFSDTPMPSSNNLKLMDEWITQKKENIQTSSKRISLDLIRKRKRGSKSFANEHSSASAPPPPPPLPAVMEVNENEPQNNNIPRATSSPLKQTPMMVPTVTEQSPTAIPPIVEKETPEEEEQKPEECAAASTNPFDSLFETSMPTTRASPPQEEATEVSFFNNNNSPETAEVVQQEMYSESFFEDTTMVLGSVEEETVWNETQKENLQRELEELKAKYAAIVAQDLEIRTIATQNGLHEEYIRTRLQPEKRAAQRNKLDSAQKYYALKAGFQQLQAELSEETLEEIRVQGEIIRLHLAAEVEEEEFNMIVEQQQLTSANEATLASSAPQPPSLQPSRTRASKMSWWTWLLMCGTNTSVVETVTSPQAEVVRRRSATERQYLENVHMLIEANRAQNASVDADLASEDTYFSTLTDEVLRKEAKRVQSKNEFLLNNTIGLSEEVERAKATMIREDHNTMLFLSAIVEEEDSRHPTPPLHQEEDSSIVQEASV